MSRTRTHLTLLLLALAPAGAAAQAGSPGPVDGEVRALLQEALEAHAVPPAELPQLPEATLPSRGRPERAPGVDVREKATAHASARAREVLERLRVGRSPSRVGEHGREVEAAAAQDRLKQARRQGLPGADIPLPPGTDAPRPDTPGRP